MKRQVFKDYQQGQSFLLPPDINEMIPEGHLVRVVNRMIDGIDRGLLEAQYKGGGTSAYDPQMLLKVIIYAYTQRIYTSRQIAKALRENLCFMWLSGMNRPDFRTINRFRTKVMKAVIDEVFYGIIEQLLEMGMIDLQSYFVDGTKIEANANKYSFVWRKSTRTQKGKLQEKVKALLERIDELEREEEQEYEDRDLNEMGEGKEIDSEKLKEVMEKINQRIKKEAANKDLKAAKRQIEKDFLPRMKKYEAYEEVFSGRNSFSKTDPDATFMRMKEDAMKNGQLKAGYNVQVGTQKQFILGYSMHQRPGDTLCMQAHLEKIYEHMGRYPEDLIADAGYGSEENYAWLQEKKIAAYIKYKSFDDERKRNYKKKYPYRADAFVYQEETDEYECPQGKKLRFEKEEKRRTESGYGSKRRIYRCVDCSGCPVKEQCSKGKGNRQIAIGAELERYRQAASERLGSEQGRRYRSKRPVEVEAVFGRLKQNWGFRRFILRGLEKVSTEWGILCVSHNIAKAAVA
jgi:transposase